MDLFIDPDGVVVVRNCGCGKHGLTSLWDDHDEEWQKANRVEAEQIVARHRARPFQDKGRFDQALKVIEKVRDA